MKNVMLILLSVLLISACSMPETRIYGIELSGIPAISQSRERTTGDARAETGQNRSIAVFVDSPRHLAQPYIVRRNSPYSLEISKYSKWVSPPSEMVREAVKEYLSSTGLFREVRGSSVVRDDSYTLEINLKKFEQSKEGKDFFGDILFDVRLISPGNEELYRDTVSSHVRLDDRTYLSLAKGLSAGLSDGVSGIADKVLLQFQK